MIRVFITMMLLASAHELVTEPVVKETREGGTSVIHIPAKDGADKVYRIDLSQHHFPVTSRNDLLKKWESYRFGAFVCFNSNRSR